MISQVQRFLVLFAISMGLLFSSNLYAKSKHAHQASQRTASVKHKRKIHVVSRHSAHKHSTAVMYHVVYHPSHDDAISRLLGHVENPIAPGDFPNIQANAFLIVDDETGKVMGAKNSEALLPIASITKLVTAMVTLDAKLPMDELIAITGDDVDMIKNTHSRLEVGTALRREELLMLALMSSENRAAAALARSYPEGTDAFVLAMNKKGAEMGMQHSRFFDPTGLNSHNHSTAQDLAILVKAARGYPEISRFTTFSSNEVSISGTSQLFKNTNPLVGQPDWEIGLSKTGFIREAGKCLIMYATVLAKPFIIVLLDSWGKDGRVGDAIRVKEWLEAKLLSDRKHEITLPAQAAP